MSQITHVTIKYTNDESISVCITRQASDCDALVPRTATPLVKAGCLLSKYTHI